MRRRDVERFEVVPVRLRFGPLGNGETHAHEDVLELGPGLAGGMQVPAPRRRAHLVGDDLCQVEPIGQKGLGALGLRQFGTPRRQQRLQLPLCLAEEAAGVPACLGVEVPQGTVGTGQRRALAQELRVDLVQVLGRWGSLDGPHTVDDDAVDVEVHVVCCHVAKIPVVSHHFSPNRHPRCYVARHRRPVAGETPRSRRRRRPRRH